MGSDRVFVHSYVAGRFKVDEVAWQRVARGLMVAAQRLSELGGRRAARGALLFSIAFQQAPQPRSRLRRIAEQ